MYYDSVRGGVEVVFFLPLFTRRQSFDSGYWRKQSLPRLRNLIDSEMSSLDSSVRRTRLFAAGPTLVARSVLPRKRAK